MVEITTLCRCGHLSGYRVLGRTHHLNKPSTTEFKNIFIAFIHTIYCTNVNIMVLVLAPWSSPSGWHVKQPAGTVDNTPWRYFVGLNASIYGVDPDPIDGNGIDNDDHIDNLDDGSTDVWLNKNNFEDDRMHNDTGDKILVSTVVMAVSANTGAKVWHRWHKIEIHFQHTWSPKAFQSLSESESMKALSYCRSSDYLISVSIDLHNII